MHPSAKDQIIEYLTFYEGRISWMYLDSRGLVSTGIGILLDPFEKYGRSMPFYVDGRRATDAEVKAEWDFVKSKRGPSGGPQSAFLNANAFKPVTKLRVPESDIDAATMRIVKIKEGEARSYFGADFDRWPADVQVVLVQMAYAGGLRARKGELLEPLSRRDWLQASTYTYLRNADQGKAGYKTYNLAFRYMMQTAWILDQCSKLKMFWPSPNNITLFYGIKQALQVARWYLDASDARIRTDDIIIGMDLRAWLRTQV